MAASIIGYSQADFKTLITENKLYIDRTAFIFLNVYLAQDIIL